MGNAQGAINRELGFSGVDKPATEALRRLDNSGGGSATLVNSPITTTYVAPNGSDATGVRGDIGSPFRTIQAALNAAQSGDIIEISPNTGGAPYAENVTVPPGRLKTTLRGSVAGVAIQPAANAALTFAPTVNGASLEVSDLLLSTSLGFALDFTGASLPGPLFQSKVRVTNCVMSSAQFISGDDVLVQDSSVTGGFLTVNNCKKVRIRNSDLLTLSLTYDGASALLDRGSYTIEGTTVTALVIAGQPVVDFAAGSTCLGTTSGGMNTFLAGPRDYAPNIGLHGRFAFAVTLEFAPTQGVPNAINKANLCSGEFEDAVTCECSAPDANHQVDVKGNNASFLANGLIAGESTTIDARDACIVGGLVGANGGIIDRTYGTALTATLLAGVPVTVAINPPLPNLLYQVDVEVSSTATDVQVSNKTVNGYDLTSVAGATAVRSTFTRRETGPSS